MVCAFRAVVAGRCPPGRGLGGDECRADGVYGLVAGEEVAQIAERWPVVRLSPDIGAEAEVIEA